MWSPVAPSLLAVAGRGRRSRDHDGEVLGAEEAGGEAEAKGSDGNSGGISRRTRLDIAPAPWHRLCSGHSLWGDICASKRRGTAGTIAQQDNTISEIRSSQKRPHTEIAFYMEQQENGGATVAAATMQAKSAQNSLGSSSFLLVRLNFGQERQPVHLLVVGKAWETSHEPLATWRRSFPQG